MRLQRQNLMLRRKTRIHIKPGHEVILRVKSQDEMPRYEHGPLLDEGPAELRVGVVAQGDGGFAGRVDV